MTYKSFGNNGKTTFLRVLRDKQRACNTVMPENNPKVKGVFFGATLKHNKGHFVRAIMESIVYTIKEYADYIGNDISEIRSMCGGAKSDLLCNIKAEVLNKKVITLKENETACLGSAIFAGIGAGIFGDSITATKRIVQKNKEYVPQEDGYSVLYKDYREKEKKLTEIYKNENSVCGIRGSKHPDRSD